MPKAPLAAPEDPPAMQIVDDFSEPTAKEVPKEVEEEFFEYGDYT